VILPDFLPEHLRLANPPSAVPAATSEATLASDLCAFVDECLRRGSEQMYAAGVEMMERYLITRVLRHAQGNQSQAARMLGITRGSLRNKMRILGIQIGNTVNVDQLASADPF
jgi:two-component system nitrogen regulation response regulator GlnG